MKNEIGVVVSRYYEDLTWIEKITSSIDVYVYDRYGDSPGMGVPHAVAWARPKDENDILGGLDVDKCKSNGINIEIINIPDDPGYEASTYAYHMHSKYDELNDYTVFLQAHPEIYVKDIIQILNNPDNIKHTHYQRISNDEGSAVNRIVDIDKLIDFQPFSDIIMRCNTDNYNWKLHSHDYSTIPWLKFCKNMPHSYDTNGNWVPTYSWDFGAGNQFVVSKRFIKNKPAMYYKDIQDFTNTYMDPLGDHRPHWQQLNQGPNVMEGIWPFVFLEKK